MKNGKMNTYFKKMGFGLIESMIVLAVILIGTAAIFVFYKHVSKVSVAHAEAQNVLEIANRMKKVYVSSANFNNINNQTAIKNGVIPSTVSFNDQTFDIYSKSGGGIYIGSTNKDTSGTSAGNYRSFFITYTNIPSHVCSKLISFVTAPSKYTVYVSSNPDSQKPSGNPLNSSDGSINKATLVSACNPSSSGGQSQSTADEVSVSFVFERQYRGEITTLNPCVAPAPQFRNVSCSSGWEGHIRQRRTAYCASNYALPQWSAWKIYPIGSDPYTDGSCKHICVVDPSSPQTRTSTPCPPDHSGVITEQRKSICSSHIGYSHWGAWEVINNTCAQNCHAPSPQTRYYPISGGGNGTGCPSGFIGEHKQQRTAFCPNVTGGFQWHNWTDTVNTCQKKCVVPAPKFKWVNDSGACGTGYSGTETWEAQVKNIGSCPSIAGPVDWTGWQPTGNTRNHDRSDCQSLCTPDAPLERWVQKQGACQAGYSGNKTWEVKQTRTSVCQPGHSEPNTSNWHTTNETRNMENNCQPNPCKVSAGTSKGWSSGGKSCSASVGSTKMIQSGSSIKFTDSNAPFTGSARYTCNAGTLSSSPISSSCHQTSCIVKKDDSFSWKVGGATCTYTNPVLRFVSSGSSFDVSDGGQPTTGHASFSCSGTTMLNTPDSGFTCNGQCPARPNAKTRTFAGCGSGKYGYWTQKNTYSSKPYPGCWGLSGWSPTSAPSGSCHACPAPSKVYSYRYVDGSSYTCSSGYYGYQTFKAHERRYRVKSYSCPAGTKTLPDADYSGYSSWVPTGYKKDYSNAHCHACPANSKVWDYRQYVVKRYNCPSKYYGYRNYFKQQRRYRWKTYNCPKGTRTQPSPSYGNYSAWDTYDYDYKNSECHHCPNPRTIDTDYRWTYDKPIGCPNWKFVGMRYQEKQQRRNKTRSYSCPANTHTLPSPSDHWGSWYDTGNTRIVDNCVYCPNGRIDVCLNQR